MILLHPQLGSREKGMLVLAASLLFKQSRVSTHGVVLTAFYNKSSHHD